MGYADVDSAGVASVVIDYVNAGMASRAVAYSVVFATGNSQGSNGEYD
jgi:hypothetical protein